MVTAIVVTAVHGTGTRILRSTIMFTRLPYVGVDVLVEFWEL
jgi:hypothetical protein